MTDGLTRKQSRGLWNGQQQQCDGKTKFQSFTAANLKATKYEGKRRVKLEPYHCGRCNNWHVGN
jgi:hypothetical protein